MMESIMKLSYYDEPEYQYLISLLHKISKDKNFNLEDPFDWDRNNNETVVITEKIKEKDTKIDLEENNSSTKDKPTSSSKINFKNNEEQIFQEVKRNSLDINQKKDNNGGDDNKKKTKKGCCTIS
jgi:hypothetical protein